MTGLPANYVTVQGVDSPTFSRPPFYRPWTVPELYLYHAQSSPDHPLFIYVEDNGTLRTICYPEALCAIIRAAILVRSYCRRQEGRDGKQENAKRAVFGILATAGTLIPANTIYQWPVLMALSDTVSYLIFMIGIMHQGHIPFPLSTRNSAIGVAHLLKQTGVRQLFISPDAPINRLAGEAVKILAKESYDVEIIQMPQFPELYDDALQPDQVELQTVGSDSTSIILHSSGG